MWASRLKLRSSNIIFSFQQHLLTFCISFVQNWSNYELFWILHFETENCRDRFFLRVGILLNLNAHLAINLLTSQSNQLTFTFYDIFRFCTKCSSFLFIKVFITCCFSSLRVNYGGEKIKRSDLKRKIIDFWASSDH